MAAKVEVLAQISQDLNDAAYRLIRAQTAYTELGEMDEARKLDPILDTVYEARKTARQSRQKLEGVVEV